MPAVTSISEPSFGFARRPVWILGHVLVLVAVLILSNLGFWQLRRLDERQAANERVEARAAAAPLGAEALTTPDAEEFRRTRIEGTFDADHEVLVGYRTSQGLPGYHLLTPLQLAGGRQVVLVNRGFVPLDLADELGTGTERAAAASPPAGTVEVTGVLRDTENARADRLATPDGPSPPRIDRVDIEAIDGYVPGDAVPFYVELQTPAPDNFPVPLPPLDLTDGPHLSYAVQWFCFAAVVAVGWMAILRRRAQPSSRAGAESVAAAR